MVKTISIENGIDRVQFDKFCMLWVNIDGDLYPIQSVKTKDLDLYLNRYGKDSVSVRFNTLDRFIDKDKKKFLNRLDRVLSGCNYMREGEWKNVVVVKDGETFIFDTTFEIVIKKIGI